MVERLLEDAWDLVVRWCRRTVKIVAKGLCLTAIAGGEDSIACLVADSEEVVARGVHSRMVLVQWVIQQERGQGQERQRE